MAKILAVVLNRVLVGLYHLLKNETHTNFEFMLATALFFLIVWTIRYICVMM